MVLQKEETLVEIPIRYEEGLTSAYELTESTTSSAVHSPWLFDLHPELSFQEIPTYTCFYSIDPYTLNLSALHLSQNV
jgi:hypothetical protein